MVIIRDLDENGNLVDPSTRGKHITLWNYCYRNINHPNRMVDCKLAELHVFSSSESSIM